MRVAFTNADEDGRAGNSFKSTLIGVGYWGERVYVSLQVETRLTNGASILRRGQMNTQVLDSVSIESLSSHCDYAVLWRRKVR
jgi:hypothetical protein